MIAIENLRDYYKILNSKFDSKESEIFNHFKKSVISFTSKYDHFKNDHFQLLNESYFMLSNGTCRKLYDKMYRKSFIKDEEVELCTEEYEDLEIYINRAQAKAYEVSLMPLKEYSTKVLKRETVLSIIWEFISNIGS